MGSSPQALDIEMPELSQVGLVVDDLEDGMDRFSGMLGIGPWAVFRFEPPELSETRFRGEQTDQSWRLAITSIGSVDVELIEPLEGENTYTRHLDTHGEGLHHVACFAFDDPQTVVEDYIEAGIPVLQQGIYQGGAFWYLDTREAMNGVILEVVEDAEVEPDRMYSPNA